MAIFHQEEIDSYKGSLTREQFLFHELRTTAKLLNNGSSDKEAIDKIVKENLFQYPTEKMIRSLANSCVHRLHSMNDESLISAIANEPSETARQICLYSFMTDYKLVWEFMVTVIGEKYRTLNMSFSRTDVNVFMNNLIAQNACVAEWSDATINKIKQVLMKLLVDNEYLDSLKSTELKIVWLNPILDNAIRASGQLASLHAFNCFE